jgi:4-hydroxybenzoate polyprenyltransferase
MVKLIIGICGMLALVFWNASLNVSHFFDIYVFVFVFGMAAFYSFAGGGSKEAQIGSFGDGSMYAGTLGWFFGLASIFAMEGAEKEAAYGIAVLSAMYGITGKFVASSINKYLSHQ